MTGTTRRFPDAVTLALLLAPLLVGQLLARSGGWLWVGVAEPHTLRLINGHTVEYETTYFHSVIAGMLGREEPTGTIAFTSAHYRMWITQFLVAAVFRWTSNLFWSFAVVELFCAWLGVLGLSILGQQLGLSRRATVVGMLAFIFSPILTSYMWRNQLHVAAIGSMAFGAGMACLAIKAKRPWWERCVMLAGVWWTTSLFYQYHWAVAPLTLAAALSERSEWRERLIAWVGAAAGFGLFTAALQAFAAVNGIPVGSEGNDPKYPLDGLVARLRSPDVPAMAAQLFTRTRTFSQVFHPMVMLLALVGIALGPPRLPPTR